MTYDSETGKFELVIRTRGYRIVLEVPERTVRLAKTEETDSWSISLRCVDEGDAAC